jgi:hypothetical protein
MEISLEQYQKLKEIKMLINSLTLTGSQNFYLATNLDARISEIISSLEKQSITIINPIGKENK